MKILELVGDSKFGGDSIIVLRLAQQANLAGYQADVLATDPIFQSVLNQSKIPVIHLDAIHREINLYHDFMGLCRLIWFLCRNRYDIVHTHTSKGGFIGRLAAKCAGVPVIIHTVHGFAFHEESSRSEILFYSILEKIGSWCCDRIISVSEFHRSMYIHLKIGDANKIKAIPNGLSQKRILPTRAPEKIRNELKVGRREILIVTTGRLSEQKGLRYLIAAIPDVLAKTNTAFKVVLAGEGPLKDDLKCQVKRLKLESKVSFLGFRSDIGNLLAACDIFVLPSLWEGLSISLLEAMAASKPIIATTIGSNREVLQDGVSARLVPPKDSARLADALTELMNNEPMRTSLGSEAKKKYLASYTEERMLNAYINEYAKLYEENKGKISGRISKAFSQN